MVLLFGKLSAIFTNLETMSSENFFTLEESKICCLGKGLKPLSKGMARIWKTGPVKRSLILCPCMMAIMKNKERKRRNILKKRQTA